MSSDIDLNYGGQAYQFNLQGNIEENLKNQLGEATKTTDIQSFLQDKLNQSPGSSVKDVLESVLSTSDFQVIVMDIGTPGDPTLPRPLFSSSFKSTETITNFGQGWAMIFAIMNEMVGLNAEMESLSIQSTAEVNKASVAARLEQISAQFEAKMKEVAKLISKAVTNFASAAISLAQMSKTFNKEMRGLEAEKTTAVNEKETFNKELTDGPITEATLTKAGVIENGGLTPQGQECFVANGDGTYALQPNANPQIKNFSSAQNANFDARIGKAEQKIDLLTRNVQMSTQAYGQMLTAFQSVYEASATAAQAELEKESAIFGTMSEVFKEISNSLKSDTQSFEQGLNSSVSKLNDVIKTMGQIGSGVTRG